jgi:hypothetical protein
VWSFAGGGVFIAISLNPPGILSTQLGSWELTGDHAFKATFWDVANPAANQFFAVKVTVEGTFTRNHFDMTQSSVAYNPSDLTTPLPGTVTGVGSGERIPA